MTPFFLSSIFPILLLLSRTEKFHFAVFIRFRRFLIVFIQLRLQFKMCEDVLYHFHVSLFNNFHSFLFAFCNVPSLDLLYYSRIANFTTLLCQSLYTCIHAKCTLIYLVYTRMFFIAPTLMHLQQCRVNLRLTLGLADDKNGSTVMKLTKTH